MDINALTIVSEGKFFGGSGVYGGLEVSKLESVVIIELGLFVFWAIFAQLLFLPKQTNSINWPKKCPYMTVETHDFLSFHAHQLI